MSKIGLSSNTSGTATFTIASPATNTNRILTLPDAAGTLNVSGLANEVPAGSAASPSIYPTGDNNTGIFFPAADTIAFAEGGAEVMRIDSSGKVGIGTSSPTNALTVSAGAGNGIFVEDNNNAGNSPFVKVRGNRSDGNASQSFSGKLLLEGYQTNAAVVSGKHLGTVAFGGNHTDGSAANILYPASISGVAEGTFSNATTMPTGLAFYTGSTGRADTTPNETFGTERMRINSTGAVTKPFQPAFIAKGLAAQTIYTANQVIVFNTAAYNVGSGYNTTNGRFTAPVAGIYHFSYHIYLNPGNTNTPVGFFRNGTLEIFYFPGIAVNGMGLTALISLAANDFVDVRVTAGGGNVIVFNNGDHTQFRGYLVG
jgi:hypothetical protein